jgi:hypothetical protein
MLTILFASDITKIRLYLTVNFVFLLLLGGEGGERVMSLYRIVKAVSLCF